MRDFAYRTPQDLAEAVSSLRQSDAEILAGGTELLNWMRLGISAPAALVDIGRIGNGFSAIELRGESLFIGARATLSEIGENPVVRESFRVLSQACLKAASPQVRNRATLGGNVLQKTRCAYFRAGAPLPWGCNKREPGSGCAARNGLNERHAILGWTDACVATQPSDPAVALACLDAAIELIGPNGPHRMPLTAFHLTQQEAAGRGSDAAGLENQLAPGELIAAFHIPLRQRQRSAYVKVRERESFEYALVSAAVALDLDGGTIHSARIALGSVAQKPWRLPAAETALSGIRPSREAVLPPIRAALAEARALEHNAYKIELAANAATRAVLIAGGAA